MDALREAIAAGSELVWRQPHALQQEFELRAGPEGRVVATLRLERAFGTLATAATAAGTWTFKRVGFWHPRITVRAPGADDDRAVFDPSWTGSGSLAIAGGPTFRWKATNFWYTRWDWQTADGAVALHFANQQGLARLEGQVGVEPAGRGLPELDLLITLGWYLIVLRANDDATVVAATT